MRSVLKKSAAEEWEDADVSYTSSIWNDPTLISEIFIIPTIETGSGTSSLLAVAERGLKAATDLGEEIKSTTLSTERELRHATFQTVLENVRLREERGLPTTVDQVRASVREVNLTLQAQLIAEKRCTTAVEHVSGKFAQLDKLARSMLADQEEHGDQLTASEHRVKKLMVGMKCIDNVWDEIRRSYLRLRMLVDAKDVIATYSPPEHRAFQPLTAPSPEGTLVFFPAAAGTKEEWERTVEEAYTGEVDAGAEGV